MSVRLGLMALLAEGDTYGARLRSEFEERTGGTWPLNVGQVYTTLERLVRDGLVEQVGESDAEGRIAYHLTDTGRAELDTWWTTPVDRTSTPRDELTIKLALAVTAPGVDVAQVVQHQRTSTLRHLRDLTRLKRDALDRAEGTGEGADTEHGVAWLLVLENLVFAAEAEVRWLDHVESVLARHARGAQLHPHIVTVDTAGNLPAHQEGTLS
ncbi:PadR family transcriptional regulator [Phycicoccus sp. CSK15P-2]|uniref:PadR family transcriptional regulator n=1 Tax=Phycicoccus sp. CSK15P-2 TaxID=2807627 RepID=UPI00194F844E|nr:PadR family transcriptional regulator [Phycicoccus sp. CSK15P-2]MBM6405395.1 PadR family transcriptional regulator [Phycicoccus sp. CSK15P-2]